MKCQLPTRARTAGAGHVPSVTGLLTSDRGRGGDGGGSSLDKIYQETFNWALIILARAQLGLRAKRGGWQAARGGGEGGEERAVESLEDKVLSSGCALGEQRSANNHCPSRGDGGGSGRAGGECV